MVWLGLRVFGFVTISISLSCKFEQFLESGEFAPLGLL